MFTNRDDFRVKKTIGSSWIVDEDDVVRTKSALKKTGDYKPPEWGVTGYPDQDMFDGLKSFQKREGLQIDGVMKPGGPTEKRLAQKTKPPSATRAAAKSMQPEVGDRQRSDHKPSWKRTGGFAGPTDWSGINMTTGPSFPWNDTSEIGQELPGGRKRGPARKEKRPGDQEVALAPLIPVITAGGAALMRNGPQILRGLQGILRAAPPLVGAAEEARKQVERSGDTKRQYPSPIPQPQNSEDRSKDRSNRVAIDPPPPTPGFEPPDEKLPDRTESPAESIESPKLEGCPINEVIRSDPLVFQAIDEELRRALTAPVQSHRGDEPTQWWNDRVVHKLMPEVLGDWGPNAAENFEHVGGAKDVDGDPLREKYLPNADVPAGQDGRKGSSNPDITYHYKPTETDLHLNTGKMRKDGRTGIASERRSLANLVKNAGRNLAVLLPKFRPGMDVEDLDQGAKEVLREQLTKLLGPPAK